jgi:hypothetical protein
LMMYRWRTASHHARNSQMISGYGSTEVPPEIFG